MTRVLSGDELWEGTVQLDGDVVVPAGKTLRIAPGAKVLASGGGEPRKRFAFGEIREATGTTPGLIVLGRLIAADCELTVPVTVFARGRVRLSGVTLRTANVSGVLAVDQARASLSRCRIDAKEPLNTAGFAVVRAADCELEPGPRLGDDATVMLRRCTGRAAVEGNGILRESQRGRPAGSDGAPPGRVSPRDERPHKGARRAKGHSPSVPGGAPSDPAEPALQLCVMTTPSMSPTLRPGDFMLVAPLTTPPAAGDLLLLPPGAGLPDRRVHRLVARRDGLLVTRGDANPYVDAPLRPDEALGRVVAVGRGASHWRRLDSSRGRVAGKLAAAGFRLLDALGETPRLDGLLASLASAVRGAHRPWALLRTSGAALKPLRAGWLALWLACERREGSPATAGDVLRGAWARAAAWLALG